METADLAKVTRWGRTQAWWLMHPAIEADHFCLLAALSTYADEQGYCEPSQATLARWLKRSRPWVNRVIAELVDKELLEKVGRRRDNGGTTSCRYRLLDTPPASNGAGTPPVDNTTPPCPSGDASCPSDDAPCQSADTNQPVFKQNQHARRGRACEEPTRATTEEARDELIDHDWQPSPVAVERASRLCPGEDLEGHTALFVSRCRGKGYRMRPGGEDDLWLAWLIEDRRKAQARPARPALPAHGGTPSTRKGHAAATGRADRFAAWGLAAASSAIHAA